MRDFNLVGVAVAPLGAEGTPDRNRVGQLTVLNFEQLVPLHAPRVQRAGAVVQPTQGQLGELDLFAPLILFSH